MRCFQCTKGKSRRLFLLNALAIYLHSVAYSDPTKDYYACEIIFWAGSLMMPLGYMPFSLRGSRLYLLYMRGKLMVAESRIALGLPSDLKYRRLHAYVVDHSRWILKWWAPYLIIGSYLLVTLVACIATYVNNGSQCSETAYAWITFAMAAAVLTAICAETVICCPSRLTTRTMVFPGGVSCSMRRIWSWPSMAWPFIRRTTSCSRRPALPAGAS